MPVNNFSVMSGQSQPILDLTSTVGSQCVLLKDTTRCRLWGSNPGPLNSVSDALPPRHRTSYSTAMDPDQGLCTLFTEQSFFILPHQENMSVKCLPPRTPLLYSKTGVSRGIPIFLTFAPKHRLWVLVRTASARRF